MINIDNIQDVCRGGVECGEGYVNIISCEEGLELINLLKSYKKDAERYRLLRSCSTEQSKSFIDPQGGWIYGFGVLDGKIDQAMKEKNKDE